MKNVLQALMCICLTTLLFSCKNEVNDKQDARVVGAWKWELNDPNSADAIVQSGSSLDEFNKDGTGKTVATFENSPKGSTSIYTIEYPFVWETSKDLQGSPILLIKIGQVKVQSINASEDMKAETEKKAQGSVQQGSNSTVSKDYSFEADKMLLDKKSGKPPIYTKIE